MFVCPECGAAQPVGGACTADGTALQPAGEDLLLGQSIGVYRVARLMGIGGMGRVYKAVHPTIGSRVAIKVLSRECSDRRDLVERFFAEAKAVNVIRHESIVNVLDLATLPDGRPYIVMEYLDGTSLAAIVETARRSGHPLPIGGVARLCVEVLDALGAAHAKGIVHRDLKPDNIYVSPAGRATVLDFGIAKLQPELGGSSTHTGSLMGTPSYMSPEQAAARPVDARADLYAMGVILFECLALQRPFAAASLFDLLKLHIEAPPPSLRALRPEVPEGVEHVVMAALAKRPDERFASAHAMSMALQNATAQLLGPQWAPIQPAFASRPAPAGGWAPTPPASWAGSGSRANEQTAASLAQQGASVAQYDMSAAAPPTRAPEAHQSAHAAAMADNRAVRRSRTPLWIALAAGVAAAGVVGVVVWNHSDREQPRAPGPTNVVVAEPAADSGPAPIPVPSSDPWGGGDLSPDEAARLDKMLDNLPPELKKGLPAPVLAAMKKYGGWSKIPDAERKKLLALVTQSLGGGGGGGDDLGGMGDMLGAFDQANAALAGMDEPAPPKGDDGWIQATTLGAAADAKKVDTAKAQAWAIAQAKKLFPDATLYRYDAIGVFPDGHADLTAVEHGSLTFRFIVTSRIKPDPKRPLGTKVDKRCAFMIDIEPTVTNLLPVDGQCDEVVPGPPKCSARMVWKKAIGKGAPANAAATLTYRVEAVGAAPVWLFTIHDDTAGVKVDQQLPDDC